MRRYQIAGARGGQGTTTVATVVAALTAGHGPTTLSSTRPDDVCALAAVASTGTATTPLVPNLTLVEAAPDGSTAVSDAAVAVVDLGRLGDPAAQSPEKAPGAVRWLVVRGPCYLSLRAALSGSWRPDGVILLTEPGRALTAADVLTSSASPSWPRSPSGRPWPGPSTLASCWPTCTASAPSAASPASSSTTSDPTTATPARAPRKT